MLNAVARAMPTLAGAAEVVRDLVGLAAVGSIAYGAWLIAPSAGFITGGVLVLVGVIAASRKG